MTCFYIRYSYRYARSYLQGGRFCSKPPFRRKNSKWSGNTLFLDFFHLNVINYSLLALGLEHFTKYMNERPQQEKTTHWNSIWSLCTYVSKYMIPLRSPKKIYYHVLRCKRRSAPPNPIKHFFETGTVQLTIHLVYPINEKSYVAPCDRTREELPMIWNRYHDEQVSSKQLYITWNYLLTLDKHMFGVRATHKLKSYHYVH